MVGGRAVERNPNRMLGSCGSLITIEISGMSEAHRKSLADVSEIRRKIAPTTFRWTTVRQNNE